MNDVVNALKRLERAGSEHSRTTDKLREAAAEVAKFIEGNVPVGMELPRGYIVLRDDGSSYLMTPEVEEVSGQYCYPCQYALYPGGSKPFPTRAALHEFAKDIADGWLDEVAEMLERVAEEDSASTQTLEAAKLEV